MPIRLVLASSQPIVAYGLDHLFGAEPDIEIVARCTRGSEVLAAGQRGLDVLLLDLPLDGGDNLALLRELARLPTWIRTVIMVGAIEPKQLVALLELGVRGVLLREVVPRLFVDCVRKVHRGERWTEHRSEALALEGMVRRDAALRELGQCLTPREMEVLELVAAGVSARELGPRLGISAGTVKVHLRHLFQKLQVKSRTALAAWAKDRGLG